MTVQEIISGLQKGDERALARGITVLENDLPGSEELLATLDTSLQTPVIGVTGAPGAGKSSLVNEIAGRWSASGLRVAILAVDPASPFNYGAILGDRLRMSDLFVKDKVFIRSLSSRGSLGGLSAKVMEVCDLLKNAGFDRIIIETVGIGQSEVEVAGLADLTLLVLVPESGDEVQAMKSGVMEIADLYVVNKSDREGADRMQQHVLQMLHEKDPPSKAPVLLCSAVKREGLDELLAALDKLASETREHPLRYRYMAHRILQIIQSHRMRDLDENQLAAELEQAARQPGFNLYAFAKKFTQ